MNFSRFKIVSGICLGDYLIGGDLLQQDQLVASEEYLGATIDELVSEMSGAGRKTVFRALQ